MKMMDRMIYSACVFVPHHYFFKQCVSQTALCLHSVVLKGWGARSLSFGVFDDPQVQLMRGFIYSVGTLG